jgi:hypothetical protein
MLGYSRALPKAGHYTRDEAIEVCRRALPTAARLGRISEIPVRLADIAEMLRDQAVPDAVTSEPGQQRRTRPER